MSSAAAGYSGRPVAAKLGIGSGVEVLVIHAPAEYAQWLAPLPTGARIVTRTTGTTRFVHHFATARAVPAADAQVGLHVRAVNGQKGKT